MAIRSHAWARRNLMRSQSEFAASEPSRSTSPACASSYCQCSRFNRRTRELEFELLAGFFRPEFQAKIDSSPREVGR